MKLHRSVDDAGPADITWGHARRVLNVEGAAETLFKRLAVRPSHDYMYHPSPAWLAIRHTLQILAGIYEASLVFASSVMPCQGFAVLRVAERALFLQFDARHFLQAISCFLPEARLC